MALVDPLPEIVRVCLGCLFQGTSKWGPGTSDRHWGHWVC